MANPVTHIVRRNLGPVRPGQCVDPSKWRTVRHLEKAGHIVAIPATVKPRRAKDGTLWESVALADAQDARSGSERSSPPEPESESSSEVEGDAEYPLKVSRGVYRLSDGTTVQGSAKTAKEAERELQDA